MAPKQVIDTASDVGTIVQSVGYVIQFAKWYNRRIEAESLEMETHLEAYRLALKKMFQSNLSPYFQKNLLLS